MIRLFNVAMSTWVGEEVWDTLDSGYIGEGPRVKQFEQELQRVLGCPTLPVAVNSGTSAIDLALHLAGVGPGDEVITTPMTCLATNAHIHHRGAKIVWADVDSYTGLIDPKDVERKVTDRTKAIVGVDWGGAACDYEALAWHPGCIIRDAAHSILTPTDWCIADFVCYSFQAIKHLTTGDGGALCCWSRGQKRARKLRWYGYDRDQSESFRCSQDVTELGYKYHMNDIAATIGLANLPGLKARVERCKDNAWFYHQKLRGLWPRGVVFIPEFNVDSSYWLYTILVNNRDGFVTYMKEKGIEVSQVHRRNDDYSVFADFRVSLPGVDYFSSHQVSLPVGWHVTDEQREYIADCVLGWRG